MRIPLLLATCWALTNFAGAQVLSEDFDSGAWPPAGWTVLDNLGNGTWDTSSTFNHGNLAGSGECAAFDSDNYGTVDVDGELISPSIVIPSGGYFLEFDHYFNHLGPEFGDVDISVNGGAWQNLVSFSADTNGLVSLDLAAYAGATVQVRFHYYLANYEWYWHVDNLVVHQPPPPPTAIWLEEFEGSAFPPAGWTVVDNTGNGSWDSSQAFTHGNTSGGTGECAAIDSDDYGFVDIDGELITMPFDIPASGANLEFNHNFYEYSGGNVEIADVDIRVNGGTWTTLASWSVDTTGHEVIDLAAYAGATAVEVRFHYYNANFEWYWHIDDVGLFSETGPGTPYCLGDGVFPHTSCPCANPNDGSLGGCDWGNPLLTSGGVLTAIGSTSISANNTFLVASAVSDDFGVFFEANNALNGGNGLFLGDGLRCAGGGLVRLTPPVLATGNTVTMTTSVQSSGDAAAGTTKYYQYWFLTPGGPCATGANLTNGYEIVWGP